MMLESAMWGTGEKNSSISNLDEFDSAKEKIIFGYYSALSIALFSTSKEIVKTMKKELDANPRSDSKCYSLKERSMIVSLWSWNGRRLDLIESMWEEEVFTIEPKENDKFLDGTGLSR